MPSLTLRPRDTRILASNELHSASGKLAEVITYKTRTLSGLGWTYRTVVVGYKGDEGRAWFGTWATEELARRGHADTCERIHSEQGVTMQ